MIILIPLISLYIGFYVSSFLLSYLRGVRGWNLFSISFFFTIIYVMVYTKSLKYLKKEKAKSEEKSNGLEFIMRSIIVFPLALGGIHEMIFDEIHDMEKTRRDTMQCIRNSSNSATPVISDLLNAF